MRSNKQSLTWLAVSSAVLIMSGCASNSARDQDTIANLSYHSLKRPSSERLVVTTEDVIKRYQAYMEVVRSKDIEVMASRRVASIRLKEQEAAWTGDTSFGEEDVAVDPVELEKTIADYEQVLRDFPNKEGNDEVLYQLAKAYNMAGKPDQIIRVLGLLATGYPKSQYYTDSEFRLGEFLYTSKRYAEAQESFTRLQNYGRENNKYYVNAGYMLGWSLFKQSEYETSLRAFARVMDEDYNTAAAIRNARGAELEILKDSIYAMAVIFSYRGEWDEIGEFFGGYGNRHYEYLIYERLADYYYEQKYYQSGASTLAAYVERFPDSEKSPLYYQKIVQQYSDASYALLKRQYESEYIDRFGIDSQYWADHNDEVRSTIREPLAAYIMDLARFNHGFAQQSKNPDEKKAKFAEAAKWYDQYIRSFPDAADAAEAHFLMAEIAYQLEDYRKAKDEYEIVAYSLPDNPRTGEAAYATILAYAKYKPSDAEASEWNQASAQNSMRFVRNFPDHPERGRVLVATSELFLTEKNYKEALDVSRLAWEVKDTLADQYRYGAALVRGHAAFELGEYAESEESLNEALKYNKINAKTRQELREKVAAAIYKQGEKAKAEGNYELAAASWKRIGDVVPGSKNSIIAEYDAATLMLEAGDYAGAETALKAFQRKYPDDKLAADIPSKLIFVYEKQEKWGLAANRLADIWRTAKDKEEQRIAAFQSGEYYEKAGDTGSAIVMFKRYANNYPEPFDPAIESVNKLQELYGKEGDEEKRRFWLNKVIEMDKQAGSKRSERSRYLAAGALFEFAEEQRASYEKIKLTLPLNKSIPVKNKSLQKTQDMYTTAVESGVLEYTTASTFHIAQLYSELARALLESERPKGLDELELEEYQFLLEDQSYPFEQAAINIHMKNINRTYEGIYDEWVKKSFGIMADLVPTQYRKEEKAVNYVSEIR